MLQGKRHIEYELNISFICFTDEEKNALEGSTRKKLYKSEQQNSEFYRRLVWVRAVPPASLTVFLIQPLP